MKNIHILPTDKPSRLYFNTKAKYYAFSYTVTSQGGSVSNRHIYITSSDEQIKEGDWVLVNGFILRKVDYIDGYMVIDTTGGKHHNSVCEKIILTTDQDLIKDGVQAIDDEFLEWFVKNPSCEKVEIEKDYSYGNLEHFDYKIIIPKEEPKFEDSIENSLSIMSIANDMFGKKEEPKQENTAEYIDRHIVEAMVEVAKQKLYSEEDVKQAFLDGMFYSSGDTVDNAIKEWFEQFSKLKL
jgi:hypothetical protein